MNGLFSMAIENAIDTDVSYRKGLPRDLLTTTGYARRNLPESKEFKEVISTTKDLVHRLTNTFANEIHKALDLVAVDFIQSRLPPSDDLLHSFLGEDYNLIDEESGHIGPCPENEDFSVRILHPSVLLLTTTQEEKEEEEDEEEKDEENEENDEEDEEKPESTLTLYFSVHNSIETHMTEPNPASYVKIATEFEDALTFLINAYPKFVKISEIPLNTEAGQTIEDNLGLINVLWGTSLLVSKVNKPKPPVKKQNNKRKQQGSKQNKPPAKQQKGGKFVLLRP